MLWKFILSRLKKATVEKAIWRPSQAVGALPTLPNGCESRWDSGLTTCIIIIIKKNLPGNRYGDACNLKPKKWLILENLENQQDKDRNPN